MSNSPQSSSTTNISSLANSPSRVVIPLGPPPPTAAPVPDSSSFMLLDYLSRLARFEPRIRRYAASKLSEHREPVHAFSGTSGSTTPVVQTPRSGHSPAAGASPSGGTHSAHGFSLVDLERTLLSAAPKWWTKRGAGASAPGTPSHQHDSGGLDVDISSVFLRHTSSPSATNGGHEAPLLQKDAGPGLFLNYYTSDDLIALLTSTGVLSALAARGYSHPSLIFDTSDSFQHRLSLVDSALFDPKLNLLSSERFLVDLYMKRRRRWGTDAMVCYQLMQRVINAGGWEELREVTGEIRAPYVGLEGARESIAFFDKMVPKCSKTAKKGGGEWDVTEIAWMQVRSSLAGAKEGADEVGFADARSAGQDDEASSPWSTVPRPRSWTCAFPIPLAPNSVANDFDSKSQQSWKAWRPLPTSPTVSSISLSTITTPQPVRPLLSPPLPSPH